MDLMERYSSYISPEPNSGCWLWLGAVFHNGYGAFNVENKAVRAHRLALEMAGKVRPSTQHCALHTCDVRSCVNPDHLYWGLPADNTADMLKRGRAKTGPRKETCWRGHRLAGDNLYYPKRGSRQCKQCARVRKGRV